MLAFLLPIATKIITDAVAKIPDNEELGEQLIKVCILILEKAVKLTRPIWMTNYWQRLRRQSKPVEL